MLQTNLAVTLILLALFTCDLPSQAQNPISSFEATATPAIRIDVLPKPSRLGKNPLQNHPRQRNSDRGHFQR
jgi:hypothetical protein